jgi:hypothetical protein
MNDTLRQVRAGSPRLAHQLVFLSEIDKLKLVLRRTPVTDNSRMEYSAEHTWHAIVCAMVLREHMPRRVDLLLSLQMLAIHDIVETDAGDAFAYDAEAQETTGEREARAAARLFGLLPTIRLSRSAGCGTSSRRCRRQSRAWLTPWIGCRRCCSTRSREVAAGGSGQVTRPKVEAWMGPVVAALPSLAPFVDDVIDAFYPRRCDSSRMIPPNSDLLHRLMR